MSNTAIETLTETVGSLGLRGSTHPLSRNGSLDKFTSRDSTPVIGTEFTSELQLSKILQADNADQLIQDLAVLVSQRGVVFFRSQDIGLEDQKVLGRKLGRLSGNPKESDLHIHPTTQPTTHKGEHITE